MNGPVWVDRRPGQEVGVSPPLPVGPRRWYANRVIQVAIGTAAVALMVLADWPHPATPNQRISDLGSLEKQVNADQASCSLGVVASIVGYDRVVTGDSADRATAISLALESAMECRPDANPQLLDLTTTSAPRDLAGDGLTNAVQTVVAWSYPNGAAVCNDLVTLLRHGWDPGVLADVRSRLSAMRQENTQATTVFDAEAAKLGAPPFVFAAMGQVSPGAVVG
ncbi:MAG: hypothetical protein ACYCXA_04960 [Actinomycetes bacterium]